MSWLSSGLSSSSLWYATRSTGIVAFGLLTATTALGVAATQRALASRAWPRFATQALHRNVSLLAVGFVVVHVLTTLIDTYVHVGWWSLIVPGASAYQPAWVAFGTLAFDLLLVLIVTSLLRRHLPARVWRSLHWSSYGAWALALVHFVTVGTDAKNGRWGLWLGLSCLGVVACAAAVRTLSSNTPHPVRSVAASR
jgi:predicted ferric reductase